MDRLAGFLERRRWPVLLVWVALLLAAFPFAAKQTDHLTSGGFEVPGSGSQVVEENITRFEGAQSEYLGPVVARRAGATDTGMQDLTKEDLESAEKIGFPIVLLILLAVFGSLAAASLPLALGVASVMLTGAGIFLLSRATDMSVFVTNVASMIGIGVAVDYSLFVLARYREEMQAAPRPDQA